MRRRKTVLTAQSIRTRRNKARAAADAALFRTRCVRDNIKPPIMEYKFAADIGRAWAFDFAWPDALVALEVEGGLFRGGRHTTTHGALGDMDKYNTAARRGWMVLRCIPRDTLRVRVHKRTGKVIYRIAGLLHPETRAMIARVLDAENVAARLS